MVSKNAVSILVLTIIGVAFVLSQYHFIYGATIDATITAGIFVPQKPINLAVSIDDSSVDLSWSAPISNGGSAITDYIIEYKLTSGGVWAPFADGVSTNSFTTVLNLSNDTSYSFRVSAVNAIGQGPVSDEVTAIPGPPAQVLITGLSDVTIPSIVAGLLITNEGSVAYEYQYTWCVTNSDVNLCGGGDDVFSSTAAKLIQPGENWGTNLSAAVSSAGNYWFHAQVTFGSDTSYASQSFTAVVEQSSGGGGSSSGSKARSCVGGDINRDRQVTLVDFSILLVSFNLPGPFANACVDINRDGKVNVVDFSILLTQWGKRPVVYKNI